MGSKKGKKEKKTGCEYWKRVGVAKNEKSKSEKGFAKFRYVDDFFIYIYIQVCNIQIYYLKNFCKKASRKKTA